MTESGPNAAHHRRCDCCEETLPERTLAAVLEMGHVVFPSPAGFGRGDLLMGQIRWAVPNRLAVKNGR